MKLFDKVLRFKFLVSAEGSPLAFNERLVYSFLVYRYCLIKHVKRVYPTTATRIGAGTGLDRRTTISTALTSLASRGLVVKRGTGWYAREPEVGTKDWFRWRTDPDARRAEWYDRLAYQWHPVPGPACRLTPRQLYLFGLYASLIAQGKPLIADKYLVKLSGLDVSTVRTARLKLFDLGLLVDGPTGWWCQTVDATGGWFLPANGEAVELHQEQPTTALNWPVLASKPVGQSPVALPTHQPDDAANAAPMTFDAGWPDLDQLDESVLEKIYATPPTPAELEALAEIDQWEVEWERAERASVIVSVDSDSNWFEPGVPPDEDYNDHCLAATAGEEIP